MRTKLNINIDHIATLRQAREGVFPDPIDSIKIIKKVKADGVVMHLREDRRHVQLKDLKNYKKRYRFHLNLEMAPTLEMVKIANKIKPNVVTLVPEKRRELTTEGGLNLRKNFKVLSKIIKSLDKTIKIMLFIDPIKLQIQSACELNVYGIEINTGNYSEKSLISAKKELQRIQKAAVYSNELGLYTAAGHGLNEKNLPKLARIKEIKEYNIGHSIISNSIFYGLHESIKRIKDILKKYD